jgi:hypothetical protein
MGRWNLVGMNGFSQSFAQLIESGGFGDDAADAEIFGSPLVFGADVTGGHQDGKVGAHGEHGTSELFLF